jgi:hypothetical protein
MRNTVEAMVAGRRRWLEREKAAKAAGLIDKIPTGRRRPGIKKASSKAVARARGLLYKGMEMRKKQAIEPVSSFPPKPWAEQTRADKLGTLTDKAFDVTRAILDIPVDPADKRLLSIQKDTALSVISTQTKVDESQLRQHEIDRADEMLRELDQLREKMAREREPSG